MNAPNANTFIVTSMTKIFNIIVCIIHKLNIKLLHIDAFKPQESSSDISYRRNKERKKKKKVKKLSATEKIKSKNIKNIY